MIWKEEENKLVAVFIFSNFIKAFAFMTEVAMYAEKMNHHPTWTNTYNKIEIKLCTHDEENKITEKDRKLAEKISNIYSGYKID